MRILLIVRGRHTSLSRSRERAGVRGAREVVLDLPDVPPQDRRQIGVDHRRVASRHELHQRRDLVRHRHLREADPAGDGRDRLLVLREAVAVHQHDRDRADARIVRGAQPALDRRLVERADDLAARADPLVRLDRALVEEARQLDPADEELRPVLVGDAQRVGEPLRDDQRGPLALALEQRVGRDRRPHLDRVDRVGGDRRSRGQAKQLADALDRGVAVALRVVGQELVRREAAVGAARDDVGERAAAVDPELPHTGVRSQLAVDGGPGADSEGWGIIGAPSPHGPRRGFTVNCH